MTPPLDFGLTLAPTRRDGADPATLLTDHQRFVQALPPAFTTLWIEDHFQWQAAPTIECLTSAAYYLAAFPAFKIGTLVLGQSYRNPALTAKMAANLQFLSQGRFILGIGAGWKEDEYRAYGYPYPPARQRIEELEDAVNIIRAMWRDAPASYTGSHLSITNAYCEPRPRPPIPLLIGGTGERYTLAVVARHADWWNANFCTVEEFRRLVGVLHERCREVGRDPTAIRLTYYAVVAISDTPAAAGPASFHVVRGTPEQVTNELRAFATSGANHIMIRFADFASLERFRDEVLPALAP
jgi:alkanesulfonate monooxygenase SsuD/methylene tetrahydromethanopterin reductase-like flavin-dependent oxidoreductase (luciferase family)